IETNIVGTYVLLEAALAYWRGMPKNAQREFRFHHISTDEVFGSLHVFGRFSETTAYDPRSPYSASKAASAHLVPTWYHPYRLAGTGHQLLQQLRSLSFSGKAHPANHHQWPGRPEAAGVRHRGQCARLVVRGRPCPCSTHRG